MVAAKETYYTRLWFYFSESSPLFVISFFLLALITGIDQLFGKSYIYYSRFSFILVVSLMSFLALYCFISASAFGRPSDAILRYMAQRKFSRKGLLSILIIPLTYFVIYDIKILGIELQPMAQIALVFVLFPLLLTKKEDSQNKQSFKSFSIQTFNDWNRNVRGSDYVHLKNNGKLEFFGNDSKYDDDEAWKDFWDVFTLGKTYLIEAEIETNLDTVQPRQDYIPPDAKIKLWCDDNVTNQKDWEGAGASSRPNSLKNSGKISLKYTAEHIPDVRIHFQFFKGKNRYTIKSLTVEELA